MFPFSHLYTLCFLFRSRSGEHPAAMQHNAAIATSSVSPAVLVASCMVAALWAASCSWRSDTSTSPPPSSVRSCLARNLGRILAVSSWSASAAGIYQRGELNGDRSGAASSLRGNTTASVETMATSRTCPRRLATTTR